MKNKKTFQWLILFFLAAITCISLIGWQLQGRAQSSTSTPVTLETAGVTLEEVGAGVYALISSTDFPPKDPNVAICNAGIIIGDDGVLVIDPFQNEALGNLVLDTVKTLTDRPVRYVLNTHFHFDHTGGNPAAISKAIPVIGRGAIRELMLEKNKQYDPNPTPPRVIVKGDGSIWLGKRQVILEQVEGHTMGTDMIAYVPDAKVLFTGDILFNKRFPYTADGNIRQWQKTLTQLEDRYAKAKIVPGHGGITNSTGLATLKAYLDSLEQLALSWKEKSLSEEQAIASAAKIPEAYKDYKFQALYPTNLQTAYQQISN
jgi:cyclase